MTLRSREEQLLPLITAEGAGVVQAVDYAPGSSLGPRLLTDYEFVWILGGSAVWTVHDGGPLLGESVPDPVVLRPGTLLLAPTGAVDSFHWDRTEPTRHAWVHFRVEHPGRLPDPATWPTARSLSGAPVLAGICGYLLELSAMTTTVARQRSDQLIALLLDLFVRGPLDEPPLAVPPLVAAALEAVRRIWSVGGLRLIEVPELAAAAGISAGHLYRTFREHYGCGPAHALELVRLARTAVMVQRSNASLAEVARACGFANAYHLSRRFRVAYGIPPGRYRREQSSADPLAPVRAAGLLPIGQLVADL